MKEKRSESSQTPDGVSWELVLVLGIIVFGLIGLVLKSFGVF